MYSYIFNERNTSYFADRDNSFIARGVERRLKIEGASASERGGGLISFTPAIDMHGNPLDSFLA